MRFRSLQTSICLLTSGVLLAAVLALLGSSVLSNSNTQEQVQSRVRGQLEQNLKRYLESVAQNQIEVISAELDKSTAINLQMAQQISVEAGAGGWDRDRTIALTKRLLESNPLLFSIGVGLEPNSLGFKDALFAGQPGHDKSGRFLPVWIKTPQGPVLSVMSEMESNAMAPEGFKEGEYYQCPRAGRAACALDPRTYVTKEGKMLLPIMSSPIVMDGKFVGITSNAPSIAFIQDMAVSASKGIFDGAGEIALFGSNGSIIAYSKDDTIISRPAKQILDSKSMNLLAAADKGARYELDAARNLVELYIPFNVAQSSTQWTLMVRLPLSVAEQDLITLQEDLFKLNRKALSQLLIVGFVVALLGVSAMWLMGIGMVRPLRQIRDLLRAIAADGGDLTARICTDRADEIGDIGRAFNKFLEKLQQLIGGVVGAVSQVSHSARESASHMGKNKAVIEQQMVEISQVVTAVTQMTSTTQEIARSASLASEAAQSANHATTVGAQVMSASKAAVVDLASDISNTVDSIRHLAEQSENISSVLDVIRSVAEQTNLLALNAAIEAARAGEQGRGFAVVADEVRSLALKTQNATGEIQLIISQLQRGAQDAVHAMVKSQSLALVSVQQASEASDAFAGVTKAATVITDMNIQIASAIEEQTAVAQEIQQSMAHIDQTAIATNEETERTAEACTHLSALAEHQFELVGKFKVR